MNPRILIVDDDPLFVDTYVDLLGQEGYRVESAASRTEALRRFAEPNGWDLVLIDQKLQGSGGADDGLGLVGQLKRLDPVARSIVVTAYATDAAIERAFAAGAYDYIEKNQLFSTFLRVRVRNALDAVRTEALVRQTQQEREAELRRQWAQTCIESNPHRKGALLEEALRLFVTTIPGFERASLNRRNELEEIDLLVRNESTDPFWSRQGDYILFECKHWSKPVPRKEVTLFHQKLKDRAGQVRLGFFVAMEGFSEPATMEVMSRREGQHLMVLLDRDAMQELIDATDHSQVLKERVDRAVMAQG